MRDRQKRPVVGILAHVDAGKTTLSEALLYRSGDLAKQGRVDHGDAFLDTDRQERARGITIFAKQAVLRLPDTVFTLLDTPGHVDFSPEAERTLDVLDYAILVISGSDGVQSHTETLWRLLKARGIPCFLFVNKMDLAGTERAALLAELRRRLDGGCTDFSPDDGLDERLALCDEGAMEAFLSGGKVDPALVTAAIDRRRVFPCYFGSALRLDGVDQLLQGLDRYTAAPIYRPDFAAQVFKITRDDQGARLTHLKITGGSLRVRDLLSGKNREGEPWGEKISQLRLYSGSKFQALDEACPGMVCAVTGLTQTYPGEGLGSQPDGAPPQLEPVLTYGVHLPPEADAHSVLTKLQLLEEEEPELHVRWDPLLQEIHLLSMGDVQLEVLKNLILERFGLDLTFGEGSIVYRETIENTVEGVGHFEPLRHYAEVHLLLEPAPRGSGLHYASACSTDALALPWQKLVLTHLQEKTHRGVLTGAPITDLNITLMSGRAHEKHTEGGDFREATYRALRQGLRQAKSLLLEPWYSFRLELPQQALGRAMSDLQRMGADFAPGTASGDRALLTGSVPVSAMGNYQREVMSYTHGSGRLSCSLAGYRPCHNAPQVIAAAGYDCDGDLQNTADSVFCSHGAGLNVPWAEVPRHMHLPSVLAREAPPEPEAPAPEVLRRAASYCAALAEDKELLAIYERTYGPVRRDARTAFRAPPKPPEPPFAGARKIPEGPEYLLVDGYNVIFDWEDLNALAQENLEAARNKLANILCNYQAFRGCKVILVFDAYKVKGNPGEVVDFHNISVVYTKEAETADMYIERVTHEIGREHRVRVVTSDGMVQMIILGHGALRVPARVFRQEVDTIETAIRSYF
ncbi:MAG: TetM/TetW/TetO/TetS family tetracycline resistance ribosomal protection protein [Pseudoflavonifractor sp.]